jgi:ankyrin repeat protein
VASFKNRVQVANLLLGRKADPNAKAITGVTPLHLASHQGHFDVVTLLLKCRAMIEAQDQDGDTPLDGAFGSSRTTRALLQGGALCSELQRQTAKGQEANMDAKRPSSAEPSLDTVFRSCVVCWQPVCVYLHV